MLSGTEGERPAHHRDERRSRGQGQGDRVPDLQAHVHRDGARLVRTCTSGETERSSPGNPHTLQSSGAVGNPSRLSVLCLNSAVARLQADQHLRQRIALAQFSGGGTPLFDALSPCVALAATCAAVFLWRRTRRATEHGRSARTQREGRLARLESATAQGELISIDTSRVALGGTRPTAAPRAADPPPRRRGRRGEASSAGGVPGEM